MNLLFSALWQANFGYGFPELALIYSSQMTKLEKIDILDDQIKKD